MTLPYDFWINNSLGFNLAISKDYPYQRATATFRKDQLDTGQNVGDQSLTGWWTRGQLSFHKGAGIKYYEVLEGDGVLNRFSDCEGVSVFTPGEVTLAKNRTSLGLDAVDAVPGPLGSGGGVYVLTDTGVEYSTGAGSTSIGTSDSGVPTAITSSGSLYYVANGTLIERQYAASDARVNHVTNPSFEVDTSGWTAATTRPGGSPFLSFTRSTGTSRYGTSSATLADSIYNGHDYYVDYVVSGLTIGQTYAASAWVYGYYSGAQAVVLSIGGSSATASLSNFDAREPPVWDNPRVAFTATATSHTLRIRSNTAPSPSDGVSRECRPVVDSVMVTESPFAGDYFDGSQPGCSWQGTPNASKSNYVTASDGDSTVRITSTDAAWAGVWWAKGRLWAVDDSNRWYALADSIDSVDNTAAFWSSTNENPTWSLADSPGPVYISDGSDIFAVTVDTDGLVPSLGTPTTAARLPLGEKIVDLRYYLSNLIVVTTRGVRVAVVQSDKIYLGPLSIKGDFSNCTRASAYDTIVHVPGRLEDRGGDVVLCALDLSTAADDLTYPWAPVATLATDSSTVDGVVLDAVGRIYAWSAGDTVVASLDELTAEGSLTTGYHRFGTLDSKYFATVSVRLKGTGEVEVFSLDGDEVATSLGTLDASAGVIDVPLASDPAERIALKFILSRDALDSTKGPTLLGYQLKALPVPKRQRMIRVPLLLHDKEQNRSGQQIAAKAWTRLAALEALEQSNAVVTFSDNETGETGSAYIESVEVERTAPPARGEGGFGGMIWLTLRVI